MQPDFRCGSLSFPLRLMPVTREDIRRAAAGAAERSGGPDTPAGRVAMIWEKEMLDRFGGSAPEPDEAGWDFDVALLQLQMARDGFWPKNRIDGQKSPEFREAIVKYAAAVAAT